MTDNEGATDLAVQTIRIIDNQPPDGELHHHAERQRDRRTRSPSTAPPPVDPDGTIAKYEWDLDGNGSYETNTRLHPDDEPHLRKPKATFNIGLG